ncbi:hypothetical protein [Mucilaginibacter terrae]|uniref:Gas vesicle protein n=1 Tax=Mucilaginibacter terrae TaxID=1955052 RepID=A0ABU3GPC1_9SPHI|nr:hypothetical protein [Mucilaginibacter terrae]MDT3401455.1 gas vesicle protein [Mucilaginibacter terrae]
MKNLFKRDKNNGLLIAGIIGGAIAAGIVTVLLTRHKSELRSLARAAEEKATDYLEKKTHRLKKQRTDLSKL